MTLAAALTVAAAAVLLAIAWALLWLDRARLPQLGWLVGAGAWALTSPLVARLIVRLAIGEAATAATAGERAGAPAVTWDLVALALLALALPLLLLVRFKVVDGAGEGALFGSGVGLGFALCVTAVTGAGSHEVALPAALFVLAVCAGAGATLGAGFGFTALSAAPGWRLAWSVPVLAAAALQVGVLATAARFCWAYWGRADAAANLGLAALALLLLGVTVVGAWSLERRIIAPRLGEEVELGVLPAWVLEILPAYGRRVRGDWWPRRDERREIVRMLVALAFRKHELRTLSDDSVRLYGLEVGRLRQRAHTLLALAPLAAAGGGEAPRLDAPVGGAPPVIT
jgi:hypothetical protein